MDKTTIERTSALESHYIPGHFGDKSDSNIIFHELRDLKLYQIAFWPSTLRNLEAHLSKINGGSRSTPGETTIPPLRETIQKFYVRKVYESCSLTSCSVVES